jgi:hypothetical protein
MTEQWTLVLSDQIKVIDRVFQLCVRCNFKTKKEAINYASYLVKTYVGNKTSYQHHIKLVKSYSRA